MENKNQKIGLIIILSTVLFLAIIFIGMTYAFFTANNPKGSTAEIKSETGRMLITYNDGTDNIIPVTNIQPSNAILVNKTFTLTGSNTTVGINTGDGLEMPYKVGVQYTSTFSDGMMHYYIKEVNRPANSNVTANYVIKPETDKTENDYKNQTVPGNETYTGYTHGTFKNGKKYTEMVTGIFPASLNDQTIKFNLIIQFPDNNENKDSEKGKTFNGKIVINYDEKVTVAQTISQIYEEKEKDSNGITPDGLQKDGTGTYNIETVNSTTEKYNVKLLGNIPNNIIADTETDAYDNLRYVGANPNNYITFNDETWRIIGLFNNITTIDEEQGIEKKESLVKIVRDESLGNYSWDSSESSKNNSYGINEWSQADLMYELNCDGSGNLKYCRSDIAEGYLSNKTSGTTKWYNGKNNAQNGTYDYSKNIKSSSLNKVAKVKWNLGGYNTSSVSALNMYNAERGTAHISNPSDGTTRTNIWDGKIALIYPSDYSYASTDPSCRGNLFNCDNADSKANNWLFNGAYHWTLSPYSGRAHYVFGVRSDGYVSTGNAFIPYVVRPVLFLKSDVVIDGGTGESVENAYTLE